MHIDARKLANDSLIEGDICIVGAGAAGISIALEWIGRNQKVILLEGGGFEYEEKMQELYAGKTTGQPYYPLQSCRLHYFGGTTGHWAGFCSTYDEIDFEKREWVPHSGWPITRKDLDPFYARAQKNVDLGPYEYGLQYWQDKDPSLVPLPFDDKVLWNKIWQFSPPTRFGDKYRDAILQAKNVHLYTYANVTEIISNDDVSAVKGVTIRNYEGKNHTVKARYFILACCSVQNARLLLASNQKAPRGLGNDHDLVGRFFMEHLEIKSAELYFNKPNPLRLYSIDFGTTKMRAEMAVRAETQARFKILNGTASFEPLEDAIGRKSVIEIWKDNDPRKNFDSLMSSFDPKDNIPGKERKAPGNKSFQLFTRIEQAPHPDSRITLDHEKDSLGVPRTNLHWELGALEKKSIRKIYELIGQQAGIAGVGRVRLKEYLHDDKDESWPVFTGGGWHHMGTTRMHDDPKQGVVDAQCKVYGIANLYIAGASCFTTAGAANPTLTLIALSLRLSDHLKLKLSSSS